MRASPAPNPPSPRPYVDLRRRWRRRWTPHSTSHDPYVDLRRRRRRRWTPHSTSHDPYVDLRRRRRRRFSVLAVLGLLAAGPIASCIEPELPLEHASDRRRLTISLGNGQDLTLPVTFSGDLPCKDCIARRVTLTLRPDTVFLTRTIWLGDPEPNEAYDLGRWDLDASGRRLILKGGANGVRLAMINPDAIRMLGVDADDSTGGGGAGTLARARSVERFDEPLRLLGYFLHTRAGPVLGECSSRKRWPIAAEADYFVLERAYRAARLAPGAPILVSVDGRLVLRRRSSGEREMVVIERVNRLWREGNCKNDPTRPDRLNRPWQLVGAASPFGAGRLSRARERAGTTRVPAGRY